VDKPKQQPVDVSPTAVDTLPVRLIPQQNMGILAHYSGVCDVEESPLVSSLDLTILENRITVQNALTAESVSLWKLAPERVIRVEHVIRHFVRTIDEETGEERAGPMLTLLGPDGQYHTMSEWAFRDFQNIVRACCPPPWTPPIRIRALRVPTRKERIRQSIILVSYEEIP
jgi:hypothetical protein